MSKKIDLDIKQTTQRLKHLLAQKKGVNIKDLKFTKKEKEQEVIISGGFNRGESYKFPCTKCKGINTKRDGTTTQIETKARFLCRNCQKKRLETSNKKIRAFFVLGNDEMKKIIESDSKLSNEQKKFFLKKYIIKEKKDF